MYKLCVAFCIALLPLLSHAQQNGPDSTDIQIDTINKTDLIDVARSLWNVKSKRVIDTADRKFYFSFLPVSSSVSGPGKMLITSTTAGFYLGNASTTYISNITFTPYLNFKGRYGLPIRSSFWLKNNTFNIQGDTRLLVYPQYTWGLGGGQPNSQRFLIDYKYFRFYQSVVKQVTSYFYVGIGYNLDYYFNVDNQNGTGTTFRQFTNYKYGTAANQSSFSSGPTLNLLYDSRTNSFNPLPGWYGNVIYRFNYKTFGSSDAWQSLYLDVRKYYSLSSGPRKNMLAFWSYYWTTLTDKSPYLSLPSIGWEPNQRSGRGIDQNRYRGEGLLYFEAEYRRDLTNNGLLGFVLFSNINSASQGTTRQLKYWNPAGGGGLRIKFNKKSDTNICIDYGISRNYSSINFNLGETF